MPGFPFEDIRLQGNFKLEVLRGQGKTIQLIGLIRRQDVLGMTVEVLLIRRDESYGKLGRSE